LAAIGLCSGLCCRAAAGSADERGVRAEEGLGRVGVCGAVEQAGNAAGC